MTDSMYLKFRQIHRIKKFAQIAEELYLVFERDREIRYKNLAIKAQNMVLYVSCAATNCETHLSFGKATEKIESWFEYAERLLKNRNLNHSITLSLWFIDARNRGFYKHSDNYVKTVNQNLILWTLDTNRKPLRKAISGLD